MWYTYILLCDHKTFYVGITDSPAKRFKEHKNGESFFTKKFSVIDFVYCEHYDNKQNAAAREKQIKGWSIAKKKLLLKGMLGHNVCTEITEALSAQDVLP